ncbi:hypothetical protein HYFRA_00011166 [Hymenoscyphus fraxineus]|uniref:Cullin family profile domain-containing protein n=1 Tax=Hymenoscyphus fraxineus TaxID=746836 RepID=A0A9N9L396_9HELO|nr:hypothetical protein HYFRA_00011166 [Hymenoscyphus fraxineus]
MSPTVPHGESGDFEAMWDILRSALREIHEKNASQLSFEQLYRASYKIVLKKQGDRLYDRVKEFEEQWFGAQVMPTIRKLITNNLVNITVGGLSGTTANERRLTGEEFMKGLKASWEDHITVMNMTTDVLMYMDRVYCADNRKASIFTTAMGLFRDHILRSPLSAVDSNLITFDILNSVILDQIAMERQGDVINKHHIRSCVYMLEGLYETDEEKEEDKLYLTSFEPAFLQASRAFYAQECLALLRDSTASDWLRKTKKRLAEEEARCQTTIATSTKAKITKVVEQEMISKHLSEFLVMEGSGLQAMIENDRYGDLASLYEVISRVDPEKKPLCEAVESRVVALGLQVNKVIEETDFSAAGAEDGEAGEGPAKPAKKNSGAAMTAGALKWVEEVLRLKDKFDRMANDCFNSDPLLEQSITVSFRAFINQFPRCSEYVSLFIDDNLKRGIKGKTEAEVDVLLDKATTFIQYIQDKDMFERYYKKHLARRLLQNKSESSEVEKQMISRMKMEMGNAFTSKLEGMFKDLAMSDELTAGYQNYIRNLGDLDRKQIDLNISVLTTNNWPTDSMGGGSAEREENRKSCNWPPEITTLQESFKAFYLKERNGRMLTWLGYQGNADVKMEFPKIPGKSGTRSFLMNCPTYSMLILLLFNDLALDETISFEEIQERTNIPTNDLVKSLYTLSVVPKGKVLNKHPNNKEKPKKGDAFSFNPTFTSKAIKFKAPVISGQISNKVEGEEERKQTEKDNDKSRGIMIDATIVRTMKARQTLSHLDLFTQVIQQLASRFKPDIPMMKKQIESLIEREYMERVDGAETATYRYLA